MKYSEIKIGMKVRIRAWEDMVNEFGVDENGDIPIKPLECNIFQQNMRYMCGEVCTVLEVSTEEDEEYVYLEKFSYEPHDWGFSAEMLEPVEIEESFPINVAIAYELDLLLAQNNKARIKELEKEVADLRLDIASHDCRKHSPYR